MALDLRALLSTARVQARITTSKQAIRARVAQRTSTEEAADEYARSLEKRRSLNAALSSESIDGMRFRWLGDHSQELSKYAGLCLGELRDAVDLAIKKEAIRRMSELRREQLSHKREAQE